MMSGRSACACVLPHTRVCQRLPGIARLSRLADKVGEPLHASVHAAASLAAPVLFGLVHVTCIGGGLAQELPASVAEDADEGLPGDAGACEDALDAGSASGSESEAVSLVRVTHNKHAEFGHALIATCLEACACAPSHLSQLRRCARRLSAAMGGSWHAWCASLRRRPSLHARRLKTGGGPESCFSTTTVLLACGRTR
jgi:hypothetical protein